MNDMQPLPQTRFSQILFGIILILAIFLPRVFDLDQFLTADEKRWQANVAGFTMSLAHGKWDNLFQQPHPGITTQWFAAPGIHNNSWVARKVPLVIAQGVILVLIGYVFARLWGTFTAGVCVLLLALNPLLIAHSRIYAMDSLLALFSILSLGTLFLWRRTHETRYLVFAGATAALAILSKLPGIILIPFSLALIAIWLGWQGKTYKKAVLSSGIWLLTYAITLGIVLPSLVTNAGPVLQDILGFFSSGDYVELHQEGPMYYVRSLVFFTTPLHFLFVLGAIAAALSKEFRARFFAHTRITYLEFAALILFAIGFFIMMTLGAKKGDRYILPVFLVLDIVSAVGVAWAMQYAFKNRALRFIPYVIIALIAMQTFDVARLHPYTLAYVNPITKPFFNQQRLGWGEGLDIAADYLNSKQNAEALSVTAYYPVEFSAFFKGSTSPLHQWNDGGHDYAVVYRAMYDRGEHAWETDVLKQFETKTPEKIIYINDIPYVWIYLLNK